MRILSALLGLFLTVLPTHAADPAPPQLLVREVQYAGTLTENAARFTVTLEVESLTREAVTVPLFAGEVAVLAPKLPAGIELVRDNDQYRLVATRSGKQRVTLELVAKVVRSEPWDTVAFTGPVAAIAAVSADAPGAGVELQLLNGTVLASSQDNSGAKLRGFLAADRKVALRWQSRARAEERRAVTACATAVSVQVTPTVLKFATVLRYDILQGSLPRVLIGLPDGQALTRVEGGQIRDWHVAGEGAARVLTIEFIKPVEKSYELKLATEQTVESTPLTTALLAPEPREIGRESGTITVAAEDTVVEFDAVTGLQQINPPAGAVAAYRFFGRPFALRLSARRIEPVIETAMRTTVRVADSRLLVTAALTVQVAKAGVYALELAPLAGFTVADVKGEGIEDWRATDGKLKITFGSRVLGQRVLEVRLERALAATPSAVRGSPDPAHAATEGLPVPKNPGDLAVGGNGAVGRPAPSTLIMVAPLRVSGATKETAQVGVAAAPGLRVKTTELVGLREIPVTQLAARSDETLGFTSEQADWKLTLASERLAARVLAEVFNLVTIGDGVVGGSATIRYSLINQGVQEFRVKLPAHWKNVEFTGPNIRRRELQNGEWLVGLQDKAWGAYTLVVTYDFPFDPHQAQLVIGGAHTVGVERETGSIAITSAANLEIRETAGRSVAATPLQRIDELELAANDRALITRPVLLAYRYAMEIASTPGSRLETAPTGANPGVAVGNRSHEENASYTLPITVTRFAEAAVLQAVADRTQLTTVLSDAGQLLTQAAFMVKNNDRQFQKVTLPAGATLYSCFVNSQPAKLERDGDALLVPLPRGANRDEAVPVEIVYAQKIGSLKSALPRSVDLVAPKTDMQTTYAEWELFIPPTHDLARFGGNMIVARGTTYGLRDAWQYVVLFYSALVEQTALLLVAGVAFLFLVILLIVAIRQGMRMVVALLVAVAILGVLAGMLLPSLSRPMEMARVRLASVDSGLANPTAEMLPSSVTGMAMAKGPKPAEQEQLTRKLNEIIFPEINFRDVVITDVVNYLNSESRKLDPEGVGVNVVSAPGLGSPDVGSPNVRRITVTLRQIPMIDALRLITTAAGLKFRVENQAVVFLPKDAPEGEMITRSYPIAPGVARNVVAAPEGGGGAGGEVTRMGTGTAAPEDMLHFFKSAGVPFPTSSSLVYSEHGSRITIRNTPENIEIFENILADMNGSPSAAPAAAEPPAVSGLATVGGMGLGVAGIRPIRIEIPRTGVRFVFTKVLNVRDEPLAVAAWATSIAVRNTVRSVGQTGLFLVGLGLVWWQLRPSPRAASRLAVTVGAALVLVAVGSFLVTTRLLHVAFILVPPVVVLALVIGLIRRLVKRRPTDNGGAAAAAAVAPPVIVGLMLLVLAASQGEAGTVAIRSATYTGSVGEKVAEFDGVLELSATAPNQSVRLFGDDVALREVSAPGGGWFSHASEVKLVRDGGAVSVVLARAGATTVRVKFIVPVGGDVTKRTVTFGLPAALSSLLALTINEPQAAVEFPSAISVKTTTAAQQTRVEAVIGSGEQVDLRWTPRVKRAEETAATVFCQNAALVSFGGGVVQTRARLEYQVTQGELRQAQVRLPAGQRLLRVEGELLRTWDWKEAAGGAVLTLEWLRPVSGTNCVVWVTTEKLLGELPTSLAVETPHALAVKRETGWLGLASADELSLNVETASDIQRADAAEFTQAAGLPGQAVAMAYRYLRPDFGLKVRVETVRPQLEATVRQTTTISSEEIRLVVAIEYVIKKAGVFTLRVALPAEYEVENVTGDKVQQWTVKAAGPGRVVEVSLQERTLGATRLTLGLRRRVTGVLSSVVVGAVQPLEVVKLTGYVVVGGETGLVTRAEKFDGLTEIPAAEVPGGPGGASGVLAYKYILAESQPAPTWTLTVKTETVEPWVRAEVVNWLVLNPATMGLVSGRSLVRFEIANAPVNEFRLRVPAALKNVEISGANIRRRDQTNDEWRVQLQSKVIGSYRLTVTWEQPWVADQGTLDVAGVTALGVERETGAIAVDAQSPLQVTAPVVATGENLLRIDTRELPAWAGQPNPNTVLAWRYLRPGYNLALRVTRFEEAAVLQALADHVQLRTVIAEDGQMMTELTTAVRNNGRQYLEIGLPKGAQAWSAFVAGRPVRPSLKDGRVLLPLDRSGADGAPVSVQLTYIELGTFPKNHGQVALESPRLDVPLKDAHWELYLPPDYEYGAFRGTMSHELVAAEPVVQTFSFGDYQQVESLNRRNRDTTVVSQAKQARGLVSAGKLKEATELYSNQKLQRQAYASDEINSELGQLEQEVRHAQAGNLVANESGAIINKSVKGPGQPQRDLEDAAEKQWDKLQAAQELAVAQVLPLQVNLPTRGVQQAFTQVLQTEVGEPMTIQFAVRNVKGVGWPARVVLSVGGCAMLWAMVGWVLARRRAEG